ncbi:pyocin knob domain-containing protein [Alishewanella sp. 16-MA]|uniref:Pyocin knob domain-containing protein n=1 Tax=Alishewanella maricola TaxID=2795740 RepID=A0ABS8C1J1_9ALTE|nr:pyocin knob domain-containing protein [Alishewanella maricola]MCB5226192.1 pyocin knob domain-containing protein [Alishewanella maricola]
MTWFTATSVTVANGQTVVSVNAGDDIQLAQEAGGLIIGSNPPVEIKRSYLDGSNNKKIELRSAWPYANQSAQAAVAFPTDGDLAAATAVLKQLIDGFTLATQVQAEQGTNNTATMTALRVKQAIDFFRPMTSSATDTTAGRGLKVGDFGLGATGATTVFTGSLDTLFAGGFYACGPSASGGPAGVPIDGAKVQVIKWADGNSCTQIFHSYNGDTHERNITGGTLLAWKKTFSSANILGVVSQSAGVPTGAIIEHGSNANGKYTKFADGTLIMTFTSTYTDLINSTFGNLYASPTKIWNYPVTPFSIITALVSGNSDYGILPAVWAGSRGIYVDRLEHSLFSSIIYNSAVSFNFGLVAIGRWF